MSSIMKPRASQSAAPPEPVLQTTDAVQQTRVQQLRHTYRVMLHRLMHSPAIWVFGVAWLLSVLVLVVTGYLELVLGAFISLGIALLIGLVTVALTMRLPVQAPAGEQTEAPASSRKWLWAQLAVLLLFIVFTGYRGVIASYTGGRWLAQLPFVGPLTFSTLKLPWLAGNATLNALLHPLISYNPQVVATNMLMTPILYVLLPILALRMLRARFGELGFGRGSRVWTVLAVVCFLPIVAILISLVSGQGALGPLVFSLVYHTLVAGFPEEVLFRGALLTRLSRLWGNEWAVVLSTLLFGLWHFGLAMSNTNGHIVAAIASSIALQGMIGLWFAILFVKTRNLLVPVVLHSLWDVLGL